MLTYNKSNPPIHKWVRAGKKLLEKSEQAKALGEAIQICTKQPKNLQALVGGCKNEPRGAETPPDAGCVKCGKCKVVCPVLKESKTFTSTATKKTYKIQQKISCGSDWVIYLITCKKCSGQYVGKSKTSFKLRHSNHKFEIEKEIAQIGGAQNIADGAELIQKIISEVLSKVEEEIKIELENRMNSSISKMV